MEKIIVYKVIFPNNKIYIGITNKSLEQRKSKHYNRVTKYSKFKFHNALRKHQGQEVWEEFCSTKTWLDACEMEKQLIKYFDSCNNGYNSTSGGEGNYNPCKEVRQKMSSWQKGKKKSKQHKEALSKAKLGKKYGPRSEKGRLNLSLGQGATSFRVFKKDTQEFVGEWINRSECARTLNISVVSVCRCLDSRFTYDTCKNYKFVSSREV